MSYKDVRSNRSSELRYLIRSWEDGHDRFQEIVHLGVEMLPGGEHDLAAMFQVADSTVRRWITGVARPAPRLKKLIVEFLRLKLLNG